MDTNRNARRGIAVVLAIGTAMLTASGAEAALTIGGGTTKNVICAAHICSATEPSAVLNASSLANMLASSDVTVVSGSKAQDIVVSYAFSWTSTHRLTLDSYRSIAIDDAATVSGSGAVTLTTNDGGSEGTFSTQFPGRVDFWDLSSSLIINSASYTLVGDIATLASDIAANSSGHFALAKNYDANTDGIYSTPPIPTPLAGEFEGLGHIIDRLTIRATKSAVSLGLFLQIGTGGVVEKIGLTAVNIRSGSRATVGALAVESSGSIFNAFAKGLVHGPGKYSDVGGLVGENGGSIASSYTTGKVIGGPLASVGGLAGGSAVGAIIRNSHSTARVVGMQDTRAGGLVGLLDGSLTDDWASGDVSNGEDDGSGADYPGAAVGGLVGDYFSGASNNSNLQNCYATGNVTGGPGADAGGLVGLLFTYGGQTPVPITDSYAAGRPTVSPGDDQNYAGGLVGYNLSGSFGDTHWDTDTSGIPSDGVGGVPNEPGVTGLSDAQLKSGLPSGFDPSVWAENPSINGGRPYLIANPPSP